MQAAVSLCLLCHSCSAEHLMGRSALGQNAPQTPSLPREIKRREKLEKELREVKAALKARADEVASKEEDIAAGEERLRLAESKLHDTKVRAEVLRVSVSESANTSGSMKPMCWWSYGSGWICPAHQLVRQGNIIACDRLETGRNSVSQ